jgi:hypothetical protein
MYMSNAAPVAQYLYRQIHAGYVDKNYSKPRRWSKQATISGPSNAWRIEEFNTAVKSVAFTAA